MRLTTLDKKVVDLRERREDLVEKIVKVRSWPSRIKKSGLSQNEIARRAKVEPASMSRFINEEIEPSSASLKKIEAVLAKLGV